MTKYFGPLTKDYCLYFYLLAIFSFVIFILALFSSIIQLFTMMRKGKQFDFGSLFHTVFILLNSLIVYFVNRLFYTMCLGSVH